MTEKKQPLKIIAGAPDRPLIIGDIEIPCYVLEDETRVLSQEGFLEAIGRARKAKGGHGASVVDNPPYFLAAKNLNPFIPKELTASTTPVEFRPIGGGRKAYGYRAELLPQVCSVYLEARSADALLPSQLHIAEQVERLLLGLATVGIIALVDEATGYQEIRRKRALAKIIEKYIAPDLRTWTKTFPDEFYERIYALRGWDFPEGVKRPAVIGKYTNTYVYERLPEGVLEKLRAVNPTENGRRKFKHHQWLTRNVGYRELRDQVRGVVLLLRISNNWDDFKRHFVRAYGVEGTQLALELEIAQAEK